MFTSFNDDRRKLKICLKTLFIYHIEMLFYYIIFFHSVFEKKRFSIFFFNQQLWDNHTLGQNFKKNLNLHIPSFFPDKLNFKINQTNTPPPKKSYLKLFLSLVWPQLISCGPAYLMIMIGANLNIYLWCNHTNFRLYPFWRRFFKIFSIFPIKNELHFYGLTRS